ncbi:MAG: patatin-like phospholipase family protein [Gemmataceae bacterium]
MRASRHLGLLLAAAAAVTPACVHRRPCVPDDLVRNNKLIDLCGEPDAHAPVRAGLAREVMDLAVRRSAAAHPPGARPYHFLALSGGGLYGSFGVGVLNGWTASGTRPAFDVVTGISVGSIQSTFAFLGPQYDEMLREEIVGVEREDIVRRRCLLTVFCSSSLFTAERLKARIWRAITPQILCEVAAAHAQGRRLYVGTCNLDTSGLVIWDMGAIAKRGTPEALDLYRKVVLASASIPTAMPPVELPVEIDGKCHTELHTDGATADDVFFRDFMVADLNRAAGANTPYATPGSRLHVINNGKLYIPPKCIKPKLFPIAAAANTSIVYNKKRDEMYRIFLHCMETGVDFLLARVPAEMELSATNALGIRSEDQQRLYQVGYEMGLGAHTGQGWRSTPPGTDPDQQVLPRSGLRFATEPRSGGPPGAPGPGAGGGLETVPAINPNP